MFAEVHCTDLTPSSCVKTSQTALGVSLGTFIPSCTYATTIDGLTALKNHSNAVGRRPKTVLAVKHTLVLIRSGN